MAKLRAYRRWAGRQFGTYGRMRGLEALEGRMLLSTTVTVNASTEDRGVDSAGTLDFVGGTNVRIGDNGTNVTEKSFVIPFQLPMGSGVENVSFSFYLESVGNQGSVVGDVDLYGLGYRPLPQVVAGDYYEGSYGGDSTDATPIQNVIMTKTSTPGLYTTSASANTALTSWLQQQYANGAGPGGYVFLRLNAELPQLTSRYWVVSTGDNATDAQRPKLSITYTQLQPPGDTTPPVVSVTTPSAGALNSGTSVDIGGTAGVLSGDQSTVTLNIYAGGTATGSPVQTLTATANSGTGAYSAKSTGLPQGKYTVVASQGDAGGNTGTSSPVTYYTYNTLPGDANGDSTVNFADSVVVSNNYGKSVAGGPASGDFNYDGLVNFADYTIVSNNYGMTFTAAPGTPAVKTTGSGSLVLNWADNSNNETGFVVERSTDGVNFSPVVTLGVGATTYTDSTGLSADTDYYYRVKAVNGSSSSAYSGTGTNRTLPAFVHTLWVDWAAPSGGNGSYATPYNAVSTAMTAAVAGDGIVVRGGTSKARITFTKSGTSGSPITVMGTPGERVILSGFDAITGWAPLAGSPNIYVTTTTVNPGTLYTGMTQLQQARTPNGGWWVYQGTSSNAAAGTTTITDTAHLVGAGNLAGALVEVHVGSTNVWATVKILSNDSAAGTITFATLTGLNPTDVYMVKNRSGFISGPGQWASEDQGNGTFKLYYWAQSPSDLTQMQTNSASLTSMVNASSGVHDIVLSGFEIAGTKQYGVDIEHVDHATVKNNIVHDNLGQGIWMRYDTNITVSNNIVMLNGSGIGVGSVQHALITQNEVAYNVVDGMDLTGDVSGKQPGDAGFTPSDDITASQNYIHHHMFGTTGHPDGIQLYRWVTGVHIADNLIVDSGQGIMSEEVDDVAVPGTSTLSGNVIWGSAAYLIIFGHSNSNNWTVTNNTVGGEGYGPFSMTGTGYDLHNNIVVGGMSPNSYTGNNNLFWTTNPNGVIITDPTFKTYTTVPAWNAASGQDANSVKADPMFNNMPLLWSVGASSGSGSTANSLVLRSAVGFAAGQHIEIARDGILRTITAVVGNTITFDVPLSSPPLFDLEVDNWGSRTNYNWDSRLSPSSPGLTMSSTGGAVGSQINISQYKAGDFNGDGKRDLPILPSNVTPPNPAWWPA